MTGRTGVRAALLAVLAAGACGADSDAPQQEEPSQAVQPGDPTPVAFDTAAGFVISGADTIPLRVELAERDDQRAFGLMDRDSLPADAGMIFLYERQQPGSAGFWMYRTRIPLDIAFLDGAGRILAIRQMEPCRSQDRARCEEMAQGYNPGEPYYGALEVNSGWFAERGVEVGDRVVVPGRIGM